MNSGSNGAGEVSAQREKHHRVEREYPREHCLHSLDRIGIHAPHIGTNGRLPDA